MNTKELTIEGTNVLYQPNDQYEFALAQNNDIFCIKKYGGATNSTEIHVLPAAVPDANPYSVFSTQTGTALAETDENWHFLIDSNRNLIGVETNGTASGKIEVHILSASSNYQVFSLHQATPIAETIAFTQVGLGPNDDLYIFTDNGTKAFGNNSEYTNFDLTILKSSVGNSNYSTISYGPITTNIPVWNYEMLLVMANCGNSTNVMAVDRTGKIEQGLVNLTEFDNANQYSVNSKPVANLQPLLIDDNIQSIDVNNAFLFDTNNNLLYISFNNTASGFTEVHTLGNSVNSSYQNFILQVATALPEVNNLYLQPGIDQAALYSGSNQTGSSWLIENALSNVPALSSNQNVKSLASGVNSILELKGLDPQEGPRVNIGTLSPSKVTHGIMKNKLQSINILTEVSPSQAHFSYSSLMTEDYEYDAANQLQQVNNFQTILSFGPTAETISIWGAKQSTITVEGQSYTIDAGNPAKLTIPPSGKVIINTPATTLSSTALNIQSDVMLKANQISPIYPDAHLNHKIATLPTNSLTTAREANGLSNQLFTAQQCGQVQTAMSNVAKAVQYPNSDHPKTSALNNMSMSHHHWTYTMGKNSTTKYSPMSTLDSAKVLSNATLYSSSSGTTGFFSDLGDIVSSVGKTVEDIGSIALHTVETAAEKLADAPEQAFNAAKSAVSDIASGNIEGALSALGNEAVQMGELASGPIGLIGTATAENAAKQIVMATVNLGDKAVSFVIDHTGIVGELLGSIVNDVEMTIDDAINWLLDLFGWSDVVRIQQTLMDGFQTLILNGPNLISTTESTIVETINNDATGLCSKFQSLLPSNKSAPNGTSTSTLQHRLDWLGSKLTGTSASSTTITNPLPEGIPSLSSIENLSQDLDNIFGPLEANFKKIITNPSNTPIDIADAAIGEIESIISDGVDIVDNILQLFVNEAACNAIFKQLNTYSTQSFNNPFLTDLGKLLNIKLDNYLGLSTISCAIPMAIVDKNLFKNQSLALDDSSSIGYLDAGSAVTQFVLGIVTGWGDLECSPGESARQTFIGGLQLSLKAINLTLTGVANFLPGGAKSDWWTLKAIALSLNVTSLLSNSNITRYAFEEKIYQASGALIEAVLFINDCKIAVNTPSTANVFAACGDAVKPVINVVIMASSLDPDLPIIKKIICVTDFVIGSIPLITPVEEVVHFFDTPPVHGDIN